MYNIPFSKKRGEKPDNSDEPCISLNENTGDPSDFTLYTSDNTDIASQLDYEKHVSKTNTNDIAQPIPIEAPTNTGKPSNRDNRYSQASNSNYPRTFTRSERNRASTPGQINLHQNAMLQNADILMQHGLQIPGNIPLPPMGLWNPNMMGLDYQLFGVNDVMMNPHVMPGMPNPHVMPGMPNYNTVGPTLQPDMLIPKPLFPGNSLPEPMFVGNNLEHSSSPRAITPIRQPIDCNSCMVHPPSKGSALPLVQTKPLGCRTIFVGGIPRNTTRMIINDIFRRFGNITDIRMNSKFCHVRFGQETSVDAALCFSGCRVTIGKSQHPDDSGLIFVDYSKAKDDQNEWEMEQKKKLKEAIAQQNLKEEMAQQQNVKEAMAQQQNVKEAMAQQQNVKEVMAQPQNVKKVMAHQQNVKEATSISRKEKLSSSVPPPVVYCNDLELSIANKKIKQNETFLDVVQLLKTWLDKGESNKANIDKIYSILQNANGHVKRLKDEKSELIKKLITARDQCKEKARTISSQLSHIEGLFVSASQQKVWDHLSKVQRKNLEDWKRELKKHKRAGPHNQSVMTKENDDMDLSDDDKESTNEKHDAIAKLAEENDKLKHRLEAARKGAESFKMEQIKEEKLKEQLLDRMETSVKLFEEKSQKAEARIKELKSALQTVKKANNELSEKENIKITKLEKENAELKQQLTIVQEKDNQVSKLFTDINIERSKANEQLTAVLNENKKLIEDFENERSNFKMTIKNMAVRRKSMQFQYVKAQADMFSIPEMKLIGVISAFLAIHPFGIAFNRIVEHVKTLFALITESDIQSLLKKCHYIFKLESDKGWTLKPCAEDSISITSSRSTEEPPGKVQEYSELSQNSDATDEETEPSLADIEMANNLPIWRSNELKRLRFIYQNFRKDQWSPAFEKRIQQFRSPLDPLTKKKRKQLKIHPSTRCTFMIPPTTEERLKWLKENVVIPEKYEEEFILEKKGLLLELSEHEDDATRCSSNVDVSIDNMEGDNQNPENINVELNDTPSQSTGNSSRDLVKTTDNEFENNVQGTSADTGDYSKVESFSLKDSKRMIFIRKHLKQWRYWSDEMESWVQSTRSPDKHLHVRIRKPFYAFNRKFSFQIPKITQERLNWLKDNVTVPNKLPEEFILEELLGPLPDFSDDEDQGDSPLWDFTKTINITTDPLGLTKYEVIEHLSDPGALVSRKEMKRLRHIHNTFRKPTAWSQEFTRRIQELRNPDDAPDQPVLKCFKISKFVLWWLEIPIISPDRLNWLKANVPIPNKYPEELILEKRGQFLVDSADEDEDKAKSDKSEHFQNSGSASKEVAQSPVGTTNTEDPTPPEEIVLEKKSVLSEDKAENVPMKNTTNDFMSTPKGLMRLSKILAIFSSSTTWSPELRKVLETARPTNCFGAFTAKLRTPDGTIRRFNLPSVTPMALEVINNVTVPEKLPEEFIIEELSGIPSSGKTLEEPPRKVFKEDKETKKCLVSGKKRKATDDEKESVKATKRKSGHYVTQDMTSIQEKDTALVPNSKIKSSVAASSTILVQIKTEPVEKPEVISEEKPMCDQTTKNIKEESITLKHIKKEPTDDKSANFKVSMSSSVHDKSKQDLLKRNSAISKIIVDVKKETVKELDKQDNGKVRTVDEKPANSTRSSIKTETINKKKRKVKAMYSEDTRISTPVRIKEEKIKKVRTERRKSEKKTAKLPVADKAGAKELSRSLNKSTESSTNLHELSEDTVVLRSELDHLLHNPSQNDELCDKHWSSGELQECLDDARESSPVKL